MNNKLETLINLISSLVVFAASVWVLLLKINHNFFVMVWEHMGPTAGYLLCVTVGVILMLSVMARAQTAEIVIRQSGWKSIMISYVIVTAIQLTLAVWILFF